MKHGRYLFLAALAACLTLLPAAQAAAASETGAVTTPPARQSITREIHVQAKVLGHRDIIVDLSGNITKILSNTPEDVTPVVYSLDTVPENQRPLTDDILKAYRRLVPVGTAKYGVLYDRQVALAKSGPSILVLPAPENAPLLTLANPDSRRSVPELLLAVK